METDSLLDPISADSPCGDDLEYDRDFLALEQSARGKPEQQFGDTVVPEEEPDWADARQRAAALFSRTNDLRVAILLTRALARTEGLPGFASGLHLIRELLARYWDHVHPRLDPDDGDPTMRVNALTPLADPDTLLRDVRAIQFGSVAKHGRLSIRHVLIALGKFPAGSEAAPSLAEVEEVLRAPQNAQIMAAARDALASVNQIRDTLAEHIANTQGPDLEPLAELLQAVVQASGNAAGAVSSAADGDVALDGGSSPAGASEIRSREDVARLLDKICNFIERTEPANPAPLLIRRAQRLMTKNFVEIIRDLSPDSLPQIQHLAGLNSE